MDNKRMQNENVKGGGAAMRDLGTRTKAGELQVPGTDGDRRVDGSWDLSVLRLGCQ